MSLVLPTLALVISIVHEQAIAVDRLIYPTLVPFTAALIIGGFLLLVARKQLLRMSPYDVLATKLILLFQLLIMLQAVESALVEIMCLILRSGEW